MSNGMNGAGGLPAFKDYARLGTGYALMTRQVLTGRMVHAYLFAGPKGVGKATFARFLAAWLRCGKPTGPCGQCAACERVFSGQDPDVIEIRSVADKSISIDEIRGMIATISQHAYGGGKRIVLIEPFEKLTTAAQNCLLKSLEEPQADVIFFLLSHEPSGLLGTVASRCEWIQFAPWPDAVLRETLLSLGQDAQRVDAVLPGAAGNIGQAVAMLANESGENDLRAFLRETLSASTDAEVVALSSRLKEDRDGAERLLRELEQAFHQALLVCTGVLSPNALQEPGLNAWAEHAGTEQLTGLLQIIMETRRRRQSQVNWQASVDRLLMKIVEAKTKWQQS